MKKPWMAILGATALLNLAAPVAWGSQGKSRDGSGWSMIQLDLDIHVHPEEQRFELEGTVRLRLEEHASSAGPHLLVNMGLGDNGKPVMAFEEVTCAGAQVKLRRELRAGSIRQAVVDFKRPKSRGDEIEVQFSATSAGFASQLIVTEDVAIASWTSGWHPFVNSTPNAKFTFLAGMLHVPGKTRLHLPAEWIGLVDGALVKRTQTEAGTVETWETPDGIARGFAAGPYAVVTEVIDGRAVSVYMRSQDKPLAPTRLARLIAESIQAQEAQLGPFPFDAYSVIETPAGLPGQSWSAASQQTFILSDTKNFDYAHGNVPLWGHEMAHAWWGNTIGARGTGSLLCNEGLAQLGALISIEALEGREALQEFLAYSREGFGPASCASGYFLLLREGMDEPLAAMGSGTGPDGLADSKGMWMYHMLRHVIGDELFFEVLRGVIADHVYRTVSVADLRKRFIAAAPEHDLKAFFAQWLDRGGAPIFDVDWYTSSSGTWVSVELTQEQDGQPFAFALDIEVELIDGRTIVETVDVTGAKQQFFLDTPARATGIRLDPQYKILLWRPEYGPRPGDEYVRDSQASEELLDSVVGSYRTRGSGKIIQIYRRDGALFVEVEGAPVLGLLHLEGGQFQIDMPGVPMIIEFDLSTSPASTVRSLSDDEDDLADRVER